MNPTILGVIGLGFVNQVPTLNYIRIRMKFSGYGVVYLYQETLRNSNGN